MEENGIQNDVPPNADDLWNRFLAARAAARRRRRVRFRRRMLWFGAAVSGLLLLIAAGFLVAPGQVRAAGERLAAVRAVLAGEPLPGEDAELREIPTPDPEVFDADAELARAVTFPVRLPEYLPEGYLLAEHHLQPFTENTGMVRSEYRDGERFFSVRQHYFGDGSIGYGSGFDKDDDRVTEVRVRGCEGVLIERAKHGMSRLTWVEGNVLYEIGGHLSREEVLRIADSLREI